MERYNVLLVDDILLNRKVLKAALSVLPELVFYDAADGVNATDIMAKKAIDLIFLDLVLEGKDGFEILAELKADARYRDIPVIVYSAVSDSDSINRALELGAYDYFVKPLRPDQMRSVLPQKVQDAIKNRWQSETDKRKKVANAIEQGKTTANGTAAKKIRIGDVTPVEREKLKYLLERKAELNDIYKRLVDMDKQELYSHLSDMVLRELGQINVQCEEWWSAKYELYKWAKVDDGEIAIDYDNGELYIKK